MFYIVPWVGRTVGDVSCKLCLLPNEPLVPGANMYCTCTFWSAPRVVEVGADLAQGRPYLLAE